MGYRSYVENPKYIIKTGYPARRPQVGDIVANIEIASIAFGEVVSHEDKTFDVGICSGTFIRTTCPTEDLMSVYFPCNRRSRFRVDPF